MDSTEFFGGEQRPPGLDDDKDGYGRYLLDADGKGKAPYTRATTVAKMLDSGKGLEIWQQRKVAKGVAQSPALVARAAVTPLDDKQAWREILDQAEVKSGGDEKRDLGSAFHALHEHVETMSDSEWAAVPADLKCTYVKYRAELKRLGITEVMTEVTLVNTKIGTAGKADAIFRLADGRLVIGDRKSGRITEYPHSAAVQFAIYANADVLLTWNEDGSVERHPMPELDLTTAIVIDVKIGDENTASVHVYEVDIWAGWAAALLSAKIRRWRNRRDLLTPYHPEFPPADRAMNAAARPAERLIDVRETGDGPTHFADYPLVPGTYAAAGTEVDPDGELWASRVAPRATPEQRADFAAELPPSQVKPPTEVAHGPGADAGNASPNTQAGHPAFSSAQQKTITVFEPHKFVAVAGQMVCGTCSLGAGDPAAQHLVTRPAAPVSDEHPDVAALLAAFKTKAQLQAVLAAVQPGANLARTRANLAKDAVSHPNWPNVRADFLTGPAARVQLDSKGERVSPYVGDVADEQADEDGPTSREEFSATVSNAPGPVPPDPEPTYSVSGPITDPRVDGVPVENDNPFASSVQNDPQPTEDDLLLRIGAATSLDELAAIWEAARDAGLGWPPRLHSAATIRRRHIETTAPAVQ